MSSIWNNIAIKKGPNGCGDTTVDQKNQLLEDATSKWLGMHLSQEQIAFGIAMMGVESGFNPNAGGSSKTEQGLGQLTGKTWKDAVNKYNRENNGNYDPNTRTSDVNTQIDVMGAWIGMCWDKAGVIMGSPELKNYNQAEIAYGLWHESAYSSAKHVAEFLKNSGMNGYNKEGVKGYFKPAFKQACGNLSSAIPINFIPDFDKWGLIGGNFKAAKNARRPDPLLFDLDGDGLETTAANHGAYFDHDGNGFAELTGWASSDDGMLVRDVNNDGEIKNGGELFGDQTLLQISRCWHLPAQRQSMRPTTST